MWYEFLSMFKQSQGSNKLYLEYLLIAVNQLSFDRELLLEYIEQDSGNEAVRDLYIVKGLRMNHGDEIPEE